MGICRTMVPNRAGRGENVALRAGDASDASSLFSCSGAGFGSGEAFTSSTCSMQTMHELTPETQPRFCSVMWHLSASTPGAAGA